MFTWVSDLEGVISEAGRYVSEEELWAGLSLFVREYIGDVSNPGVAGFRIDLATEETSTIGPV